MIDITDEITRLWGKLTGKTPNLWFTDYSKLTEADIKAIIDYAMALKEELYQAWLAAKISYSDLLTFRNTYSKFYDLGSNPNDVFGSAYLDNQWKALDDATFTALELLGAGLNYTGPTPNTLGYLKSVNSATLRVCDDETNWHQYLGYPLSVVRSVNATNLYKYGYVRKDNSNYGYPFSYVLQHNTGPVAVLDVSGIIIEVLDSQAFSSPIGTRTLSDIPILPHNPIPTDGDYVEHTNEYTVLWLICQLRYAKAMLDSLLAQNVYLYNQANQTTSYVPPKVDQTKNDEYVPLGIDDKLPPPVVTENPPPLPVSDEDKYKLTTDIQPVSEVTGETNGKKSTTMDWLVPVLAGLGGAALVGGVIWYSVKKEEQYGLIGSPRVKHAAEPKGRIPEEVKQVINAMQDNAVKANQPENSVYVSRNIEQGEETWTIGDNYERIALNLVYKDGTWYYRYSYGERDRQMPGGFREAMGNAQVFYTG